MTQEMGDDRSRVERRRRTRSMRRAGVAALVLVIVVALGAAVYGVVTARRAAEDRPPNSLVLIAESELEDGTIVAGMVVVLDGTASEKRGASPVNSTPIDTLKAAEIPGTSYDTLRDALALGGPELVARIAVRTTSGGRLDDDPPACLVLDEDAWGTLIDNAGGANVTLTGSTTVFTGEKLHRFAEGTRTLTGEESVALLRGSETLSGGDKGSAARLELSEELARAVLSDPAFTATLVDENEAECSLTPESLVAFLESGTGR